MTRLQKSRRGVPVITSDNESRMVMEEKFRKCFLFINNQCKGEEKNVLQTYRRVF